MAATLWLDAQEGARIVEADDAAAQLFGLQADTLRGRALTSFAGSSAEGIAAPTLSLALVEQGETLAFDWSFRDGRGRVVHCETELRPEGRRVRVQLREVDLNERAEALRQGQAELLELVARGAALDDTLLRLTQLIESQSVGLYCSLLLLDEDGVHIAGGVGPRLRADYMAALNGYAIGPTVGSCGTAMTLRRMVIVSDIENDPLWAPYKFLVVPHGLRACWSTPIYLGADQVLGSFAMYYKEVRSPQPVEMRLMEVARHLAGIAIERDRRARAQALRAGARGPGGRTHARARAGQGAGRTEPAGPACRAGRAGAQQEAGGPGRARVGRGP